MKRFGMQAHQTRPPIQTWPAPETDWTGEPDRAATPATKDARVAHRHGWLAATAPDTGDVPRVDTAMASLVVRGVVRKLDRAGLFARPHVEFSRKDGVDRLGRDLSASRENESSVYHLVQPLETDRQFDSHTGSLSRIRAGFAAPETLWSYSAAVSKRLVTARPGC